MIDIKNIFEEDQLDRKSQIDLYRLKDNDSKRIAAAYKIYFQYERDPESFLVDDLYYLAMIFQHGNKSEDYKLAFELASIASKKGNLKSKWLSAATEDRYLLSTGNKQKWGTQFIKSESNGWQLQPMESDEISLITDIMRKERNIPERAKLLEVFLNKLSQNNQP